MSMPAFVLAPLSGILMAAAMIHAGSTVIDSLPHGSFFHATGGAVNMSIGERMKLIPFEACVGLTSTIVSVILFLIVG
jgi:GntP family gluconate:H+ symporter